VFGKKLQEGWVKVTILDTEDTKMGTREILDFPGDLGLEVVVGL